MDLAIIFGWFGFLIAELRFFFQKNPLFASICGFRVVPGRVVSCIQDENFAKYFLHRRFDDLAWACKCEASVLKGGYASDVYQVQVEAAVDGGKCRKLIVKTPRGTPGSRAAAIRSGRFREALFFQHHDTLASVRVPRCTIASCSPWLGEFVLFMDPCKGKLLNHLTGNQCWGVEGGPAPDSVQVDAINRVAQQLARFHTQTWNDAKTGMLRNPSFKWLNGSDWFVGKGRSRWERGLECARSGWASGNGVPDGVNMSPALRKLIQRSLDNASFDAFLEHLGDASKPIAVCHNDCYCGNMFWDPKGDEKNPAILFDWSEVGWGFAFADLAQLIISDVNPTLAAANTRRWFQSYYSTLTSSLPPFEDAFASFIELGLSKWVIVLCIMFPMNLPKVFFDYLINQVDSFRISQAPEIDVVPIFQVIVL